MLLKDVAALFIERFIKEEKTVTGRRNEVSVELMMIL